MILLSLAGWAAARWGGVLSGPEQGLLAGLLLGVVVAPFVPLPAPPSDTPGG